MNKEKRLHKKRKRSHVGITWKMFGIFFVFILLFAVSIWVFQFQMLRYFYQGVKYGELNKTVQIVNEVKDTNSELVSAVSRCASDTYGDIWVYRVDNGNLVEDNPVVFSAGAHDSRAVFLQRQFDMLYQRAIDNGGKYLAVFSIEYFKSDNFYEFEILSDNQGRPTATPNMPAPNQNGNAIQIDIIKIDEDTDLVVIQRAKLEPMSALIETIRVQVIFTTVVLMIFSVIMVIIMSRMITKPIIRINEEAKNLGKGKYKVEFSGDSYREICELSDTLNYAATELSKNDDLQKELISNISHDLRTPLTMIRGYSELMRDIPGENTPENFQVIIDETTRLAELVNGMLDLSRIQSGARVPEKKIFCLTEVIRATLTRYEKLVLEDGYKIEFECSDEAVVFADQTMILQVVYNFINNAINYTGEDKYIKVTQEILENKVRISVIDTGEGILKEDIPYIWDRYYKVDKVHRRATVGTGLGLSIAKDVLEIHNATYGVESKLKEGSTFWFELDLVDLPDDNEILDY